MQTTIQMTSTRASTDVSACAQLPPDFARGTHSGRNPGVLLSLPRKKVGVGDAPGVIVLAKVFTTGGRHSFATENRHAAVARLIPLFIHCTSG